MVEKSLGDVGSAKLQCSLQLKLELMWLSLERPKRASDTDGHFLRLQRQRRVP